MKTSNVVPVNFGHQHIEACELYAAGPSILKVRVSISPFYYSSKSHGIRLRDPILEGTARVIQKPMEVSAYLQAAQAWVRGWHEEALDGDGGGWLMAEEEDDEERKASEIICFLNHSCCFH